MPLVFFITGRNFSSTSDRLKDNPLPTHRLRGFFRRGFLIIVNQ